MTAVVLGGTSVFGGRGTITGTVIGLLAIAVLKNGLALAALPSELVGVLTGALLVAAIGADRIRRADTSAIAAAAGEEGPVKNSQVAVLCAAILGGALLVASTNVWRVRSVTTVRGHSGTAPGGRRPVIALMPKA